MSQPESTYRGFDRRARPRTPCTGSVRLFVLDHQDQPVAERYCSAVDHSDAGLSVSTPGTLAPGTRVVVMWRTSTRVQLWLAVIIHTQFRPDGLRVLGLKRLEMPERMSHAHWINIAQAAA